MALVGCAMDGLEDEEPDLDDIEAPAPKLSGTIELNQPDPHHGDVIDFSVSVTGSSRQYMTEKPFVQLYCYQDGVHVYAASVGYFPSYPWWQTFTLSSQAWPSGAASCEATLYLSNPYGTRRHELAILAFDVAP